MDRALSMASHVETVVTKARLATTKLRPLLSSKLLIQAKLGIYKNYVRSHLTFSGPAWYNLTAGSSHREQVPTHDLWNSTIYRDFRWEPVDAYVWRLATVMFERADCSILPHRNSIAVMPHPENTFMICRRLKRPAWTTITNQNRRSSLRRDIQRSSLEAGLP